VKSRKMFVAWIAILVIMALSVMNVLADQGTYTVKPGDTISAIAQQYGVTTLAIIEANGLANPNFIVSGQELIIPDRPSSPVWDIPTPEGPYVVHVVQPGDTTYTIAMQYGVTMDAIVEANNLENFRVVRIGKHLFIPGVVGTPTPVPASVGTTSTTTTAAATPVPPPAAGANLFTNGSFEGSIYDHNGVQELQVPQGWYLYVDEGPNTLVPGSGGNFFRPESRVFATTNIPADEVSLYIWEGTHAIKVFKGGAPTHFGLFTDVYLQPGTYRATFRFFADAVLGYDGGTKIWATDPLSAEYRIIHGAGGTDWTPATIGQKNTITYTFTVSSSGAVRLGVGFRNRYVESNNGWLIDDWSLVKVN